MIVRFVWIFCLACKMITTARHKRPKNGDCSPASAGLSDVQKLAEFEFNLLLQ